MLSQCLVAAASGAAPLEALRACSRTLIKPPMDIEDHQLSLVFPSSWCTSVVSSPYPTRVPSAMALSKSAWVLAATLSISPHCARGITQSATYVYIRGFSFTSCACASVARIGVATSPHTTATTLHDCL